MGDRNAQPPPSGIAARLDGLPSSNPGRNARLLWGVALGAAATGGVSWATGTLQGGVIALWAFMVMAVAVALVLPAPAALVSPLFTGLVGWLVNMMPLVLLAGWTGYVVRWVWETLRAGRRPRGGRWIWLPLGLVVWTGLGVLVISTLDFKHFLLLLGIQVLISGSLLACVDRLRLPEQRTLVASGLVLFVVVLSVAVFLQWIGVPIQPLQNDSVRRRVETAYGVDAFPNNIGMIKYARSVKSGVNELIADLGELRRADPELPASSVFRPKFQAYENHLLIRFKGSARPFEAQLEERGIELLFDNIGLAPANTVPRLRSFPRNALTFAGVCAALLPLALFLWWTQEGRKHLLGRIGVASCLFGAAFSLARGAWVAIAVGLVYFVVDAAVSRRRKIAFVAAYLVAATVLTGVFLVRYGVDPVKGRAGGGASVSTRDDLYRDTLGSLRGRYILLGYGTERPRTESGTVREGEGQRYVPRAGTHSTYLNYLFRTGLPGALAVIALYVIAGLHARAVARERDGDERVFAATVTSAVVIAAAHGVILSLYVEPIYTLSIATLLGVAMACAAGLHRSVLPWRRGPAT